MASLLRNIAPKNFVNFLEVLKARKLVSFRQTFIKGDVLRVSSNSPAFIDPHKRESHRKQRRNFPYTLFAVLGIAAATSNNTEEDSLPTSSVSQNKRLLQPGVLQPGVLTTRGLTNRGC